MYAKKYEDTEKYVYQGDSNVFYMLVPRDDTEAMESCLVYLKQGEEVPEHSHNEEQIYFVLRGEGLFKMEGEEAKLEPEMVVYIPRGAKHQVKPLTEELVYVYVAVWPGGIPAHDKDWRKAMGVPAPNAEQ